MKIRKICDIYFETEEVICMFHLCRKKLASTNATDSDRLKCGMDEILEAQTKGEINEDHVLFIVENINVAGTYKLLLFSSW
jgi:trans-cinnamate 4-monooxygenase